MSSQPLGWTRTALSEIVEILDSERVPVNSDERAARIAGKSDADLVPYYGATGQVGWIDQALFDEELVLLGEDGVPFHDFFKRKAYRITGKSWVNNHAHVLRAVASKVDARYLERYLNRFDYVGSVTGSTRLKLTQAAMVKIPVVLAPLREQQRIADKLDTVLARVDACSDRLARVAPLLKRFRQSVLAAATSGRLTEDWRLENCDSTSAAETTLGAVILDMRNGLSPKPSETPPGARILRISSVRPGRIDFEDHRFLEVDPGIAALYDVRGGDLLFTRYNGSLDFVGVCAVVLADQPGFVYPDKLIRVRVDANVALPRYIEIAFGSHSVRKQVEEFVKSSAGQKGISGGDLKTTRFPLPSQEEQTEIVRRVGTLFAFADRLEARLTQAQTAVDRLTPSLLAKAFRGELVPQDPKDEPASELLRRLQADRPASNSTRRRAAA